MNEQLLSIIHDVRRRWRAKLLVRGAALTAACGGAALVLAAWGLQWMRFTPQSILVARIVIGLVFALLAYLMFARPLLRGVLSRGEQGLLQRLGNGRDETIPLTGDSLDVQGPIG